MDIIQADIKSPDRKDPARIGIYSGELSVPG